MNPTADNHRKVVLILGWSLLIMTLTGCVERKDVKIHPTVLPATPLDHKFPLSAAVVVDRELKEYGIQHQMLDGTGIFEMGEHLSLYATNISRDLFREVTVYDSLEAAANKADVILIPKAIRSSVYLANPVRVMICVEWTVKNRSGQKVLLLASIESEGNKPNQFFDFRPKMWEAFQQMMDELCFKTLKAFRESPEMIQMRSPQ